MWQRHLFLALSLSNLCYLRVWSELLTYTRSDEYLMKLPPGPVSYVAVMFNVLLVGGALWAAITLVRRSLWVEVAFLLFLLIPLNALRAVLSNQLDCLRLTLFGIMGPRKVVLIAS